MKPLRREGSSQEHVSKAFHSGEEIEEQREERKKEETKAKDEKKGEKRTERFWQATNDKEVCHRPNGKI